jgi:uncharacterized protein (UPF0261 family)
MQGRAGEGAGTIAIIGTLNNYAGEIRRLKESIEEKGFRPLLIDISMGGKPSFPGDIPCDQIAQYGGSDIDHVRASTNRMEITRIMTEGLRKRVTELHESAEFDGIIVMGGATTALIACRAMQALPFGLPKMIVSSAADYPIVRSQLFGNSDIMIMHTPVDAMGGNYFVINLVERAAGAICGMTSAYLAKKLEIDPAIISRTCVAMVTFGFSDGCANTLKGMLEKAGLEVIVFHAQGLGDSALDTLIDQNVRFKAIVELTPAGLSEELFGGTRAAGKRRLEAACEKGIPQVCTPCGLNYIGVGPMNTMKKKYRRRNLKTIDDRRTQAKMTVPELMIVAQTMARKLSMGKGIIKIIFPLKGWSSLEKDGDPFYEPEKDRLFINRLKKLTRRSENVQIREIDAHIDDELTAKEIFDATMEVM